MQGPSPPPPLAVCLLSSSPPARGASCSARCPAQRSTDQRRDHQVRRTLMFLGGPSGPAPSLEGGRGDEEGSWKDPCCSVPPRHREMGGLQGKAGVTNPLLWLQGTRSYTPAAPHRCSEAAPAEPAPSHHTAGKTRLGGKTQGGHSRRPPWASASSLRGALPGKGQNPSRKEKQTKGMGLDLSVLEVPGAPFLSAPPLAHHGHRAPRQLRSRNCSRETCSVSSVSIALPNPIGFGRQKK